MPKGLETRERIIVQAAPLFNTRGFAGSSMQDVLQATGLQKGGLYRHFSSKEELAADVFRYTLSQTVRTRTEKLDPSHGAIQHLRSIVQRFVEAPSAVTGGCPLMNTAIEADDGNPVLRDLARKGFADWRKRLTTVIRQGIKSGEIDASTEPRRIANAIIATLEGALMLSRLEKSKTPLEDAQSSLEAVFSSIEKSSARPALESRGSRRQVAV